MTTLDSHAVAAAVIAHDNEENAQRGEPKAWTEVPVDDVSGEWAERLSCMEEGIRAYLDAAPANPAQVTELIADLEQAVLDFEDASSATYNRSKAELVKARAALTAAIGESRSSEPEFETAPDNGAPAEVLAYVLDCARRWVPEARIIGNARAGDIERAIAAIGAGGQAVAVKPLIWEEDHGIAGMGPYRLFKAETPLGRFVYGTDSEGYAYYHTASSGVLMVGDEATAKRLAEAAWEKVALAEVGKFVDPSALSEMAND